MKTSYFETEIGWLEIIQSSKGIRQLNFIQPPSDECASFERRTTPTIELLSQYFKGSFECVDINQVKLDPKGTDFQMKVWQKLLEIPLGKTIDYESLAKEMGGIEFTRAVAKANSVNPIPILIPCHRVIGKDGRLTGYLGGLEKKEWLLKHEGAITQTSLF